MAFFSDFWFCAAATTLTTGALMANIFIIFVCVYKECAIMREKWEEFDWFFFFFLSLSLFSENRDLFSLAIVDSNLRFGGVLKFYVFRFYEGEARKVRYKFDIFFAFDTCRYTYTTLLFILQRCSVLLLLFLVSRISIFFIVVAAVCATNSRRRLDRKRYLFQTWTRRTKRTFSGW
jgi:hypothetical protein